MVMFIQYVFVSRITPTPQMRVGMIYGNVKEDKRYKRYYSPHQLR